jgi:hypothetical protein
MALEQESAIAPRRLQRCESIVRQSPETATSLPGDACSLERRRKARYPTNDTVDVGIVDSDYQRMPGTVLGVSRSGLLIELRIMIAKGTSIVLFLPKQVVIVGTIRYCLRTANTFLCGLLIKDVVYPRPWLVRHVHEDQLALYLAGRGLTALEVIQLRIHLLGCQDCRRLLAETPAILHPARLPDSCAS